MTTQFWKAALMSPTLLGVALAGGAIAATEAPVAEAAPTQSLELTAETLEVAPLAAEPVQLAQISSVSQLSDVSPTDWAFSALQNLVETYGCLEGYPDRTFRGNRPLTRFEFAAGLNACLNAIADLITGVTPGGPGVDPNVLATIQRLQQEFQAELTTLRGRVDALEAQTAQLRAQQFSTTTRLRGQVDANLVAPFGSLGPEGARIDNNTAFVSRARLNFDTSFTGSDLLRTRLQYADGNAPLAAGGGLFAASGTSPGLVIVDDFFYRFPIGSRVTATIAANNITQDDFVVSTIVPWDGRGVAGPQTPPLYGFDMGGGGFGAGLSFRLTDSIIFDAGYTGARIATTSPTFIGNNGAGIFGANQYSFTTQLSFLPQGFFNAALVYQRGNAGEAAGQPTDTFGGLLSLNFGRFILAGSYGAHSSGALRSDSWQIGVGLPDFLAEGAMLGVYYAVLPSYGARPDMLEAFYSLPINRFLTITPALVYGNTDRGATNTSNFYGVLRTTFSF